jgi:aldehyde dehydrogenase (NAD+)/betaine-aldehyde dehydrogenase
MTAIAPSLRCDALIGGEQTRSTRTFEDLDPATGEPLAEVARCGPAEIDQAVAASRAAFERDWSRRPPAERADVLQRIAELIRRDADELARIESLDTGKPISQARTDVRISARYFDFYARTIEAVYGDTIPLGGDTFVYTLREPHGVTGHIIPWNYPAQMVGRTIAPALAAGNCCVLKPAEEAPLSSVRIAQLALEAGLPGGAFNVVPGLGEEAGAALAGHAGIDHLSFTGSTEVGRLVGKAAADNVVPVTVELGGKSPHVVLADADLERAVPTIVNSIVQNAGQTCSAGSRLLVQNGVHGRVRDAIVERFEDLRLGPGLEDPDLGPLITKGQQSRVAGLVEEGRSQARLVVGGGPPVEERLERGFFFLPTVFDEVPPSAPIAQEEIFGPVLSVIGFADENEAVELANATSYGLVAAVWTRDLGKAHALAREIQAGQVFVNGFGAGGGVELPFGGRKLSGHGREKGIEGLLAFTRTKTVAVSLG